MTRLYYGKEELQKMAREQLGRIETKPSLKHIAELVERINAMRPDCDQLVLRIESPKGEHWFNQAAELKVSPMDDEDKYCIRFKGKLNSPRSLYYSLFGYAAGLIDGLLKGADEHKAETER